MLQRLNILLFKPRYIAKYITDSYMKIFLFFFLLIFMITGARVINDFAGGSISQTNERLIINHISNNIEGYDLKIEENRLVGNAQFNISVGSRSFLFNHDTIMANNSRIVFNFMKDEIVVVIFNTHILRFNYNEFIQEGVYISFNEIANNSFFHRINFSVLLNGVYSEFLDEFIPFSIAFHFAIVVFQVFFGVLIIYFLSRHWARHVKGSFRTKIIMYSSSWILFMMLFQEMFSASLLISIGFFISLIFARKSLTSIIKIRMYKN